MKIKLNLRMKKASRKQDVVNHMKNYYFYNIALMGYITYSENI